MSSRCRAMRPISAVTGTADAGIAARQDADETLAQNAPSTTSMTPSVTATTSKRTCPLAPVASSQSQVARRRRSCLRTPTASNAVPYDTPDRALTSHTTISTPLRAMTSISPRGLCQFRATISNPRSTYQAATSSSAHRASSALRAARARLRSAPGPGSDPREVLRR